MIDSRSPVSQRRSSLTKIIFRIHNSDKSQFDTTLNLDPISVFSIENLTFGIHDRCKLKRFYVFFAKILRLDAASRRGPHGAMATATAAAIVQGGDLTHLPRRVASAFSGSKSFFGSFFSSFHPLTHSTFCSSSSCLYFSRSHFLHAVKK